MPSFEIISGVSLSSPKMRQALSGAKGAGVKDRNSIPNRKGKTIVGLSAGLPYYLSIAESRGIYLNINFIKDQSLIFEFSKKFEGSFGVFESAGEVGELTRLLVAFGNAIDFSSSFKADVEKGTLRVSHGEGLPYSIVSTLDRVGIEKGGGEKIIEEVLNVAAVYNLVKGEALNNWESIFKPVENLSSLLNSRPHALALASFSANLEEIRSAFLWSTHVKMARSEIKGHFEKLDHELEHKDQPIQLKQFSGSVLQKELSDTPEWNDEVQLVILD